jgi:hypothetical protein
VSTAARAVWTAALLAALALALAPHAPAHAQDDPLADEDLLETDTDTDTDPDPDSDTDPDTDPDTDTDSDSDTDSDTDSAPDTAAEPAADPEPGRALLLHAAVGLGVGSLSFSRPIAQGVQTLPATAFAALEVALRLHAWPRAQLSLESLIAYQTSVGLELQLDPPFALPEELDVRTQRVELSTAPVLRLGAEDSGLALAFPIGFAFRSFVTEVHEFPVAGYAVGGPQLRAELLLRLGELVRLRIGPELQWIVIVDGPMRAQGACCQGLAVGAQGVLEASVGPVFRVAFAYHESHAFVPLDYRFNDVARYLTARVAGDL